MNRKNLIRMMGAVAAMAAVCTGTPVSAATPQGSEERAQQAAGELNVTRNTWLECVRAAIPPRLDHPEATSESVARAAMGSCSDQFAAVQRALSRTVMQTCAQDSDCTRAALAKAERDATQTATEEVVAARIRVAGAQVLVCQ